MKHHTRRAVAYIVGRKINEKNSSSVYDYNSSQHYSFGGNVGDSISIFDYAEGCHITGTLPSLFHYGNSGYISLKIENDRFSGYDYAESAYFSGTVRGNSVSIYDYRESS